MTPTIPLSDWLKAMTESLAEASVQSLGFREDEFAAIPEPQPAPEALSGSMISLANKGNIVNLAVLSNREGLGMLANAMLGLPLDDKSLSDADRRDPIQEVANVLAGGVKRRLNQPEDPLQLGIPLFKDGKMIHDSSHEAVSQWCQLGKTAIQLTVFVQKQGGA